MTSSSNPWLACATQKFATERFYYPLPAEEMLAPKKPKATTDGKDGIFFGTLDLSAAVGGNIKGETRDPSTRAEMIRHGYDPDGGLEQVTFKRPLFVKQFKACVKKTAETGDSVFCFFTEHTPEPHTTILKMAKVGDKINWVAIDLASLALTSYNLYEGEVMKMLKNHTS